MEAFYIMAIVIENGVSDPSSNSGYVSLRAYAFLVKGINLSSQALEENNRQPALENENSKFLPTCTPLKIDLESHPKESSKYIYMR